jgi:hypothetical protein
MRKLRAKGYVRSELLDSGCAYKPLTSTRARALDVRAPPPRLRGRPRRRSQSPRTPPASHRPAGDECRSSVSPSCHHAAKLRSATSSPLTWPPPFLVDPALIWLSNRACRPALRRAQRVGPPARLQRCGRPAHRMRAPKRRSGSHARLLAHDDAYGFTLRVFHCVAFRHS